jgi:uncharacterized RDD family membrane protein YckC
MAESHPAPPPGRRASLAARVVGGGARGARAVARATGVDDAVDLATEEAIVRALESPGVERALIRVLEGPAAEDALHRLLQSPAVERALTDALDSEMVDRLWERLLASDEAQKLVERIANAPEVRAAVAMQGVGLVEDLGRQVRRVADRLDDVVEAGVRGLFRRPRRATRTKRAGLISRGLALALDAGLLNLAFIATTALVALVASAVFPEPDGASTPAIALGAGAWILGIGAYLVFFWTLAGQTPGMRVLGIRLDRGDGTRRLRFRQAVRRLVGVGVSILCLGLGFFAVLFSDRRQGWHDRMAGTEVVPDERRERAPWTERAVERTITGSEREDLETAP